jgi:FMN phosphatase YigB (HAD superfamily)
MAIKALVFDAYGTLYGVQKQNTTKCCHRGVWST